MEAYKYRMEHRFATVQDESYQQEVEAELLHVLCTSVAAGSLTAAPHAMAALGTDGGLLETLHSSKVYEERPLLTTLTMLELLAASPALAPTDGASSSRKKGANIIILPTNVRPTKTQKDSSGCSVALPVLCMLM